MGKEIFSTIKQIKEEFSKEASQASNKEQVERINKKYLGKKGVLSAVFPLLRKVDDKERVKIGQELNQLKIYIKKQIEEKLASLAKDKAKDRRGENELFDITIPGLKTETGHLHILTHIIREIEDIFKGMGFSVVEGPEIELDRYNFTKLNFPLNHPSRDAQDTFYLGGEYLLRTHTSPVQVRYMEKHNPPFRIIIPGRVFRHEATDASHEAQFYQVEGLMVGEDVSLANLKAVLETFIKEFFGKKTVFRWRPGYFPFVEPGVEVDIQCSLCGGKGCPACKYTGWLEVLGAGMVHPNVLKSAGYVPGRWQGFAFGIGLDRLAIIRNKVSNIRLLYSGDLRFLKQF